MWLSFFCKLIFHGGKLPTLKKRKKISPNFWLLHFCIHASQCKCLAPFIVILHVIFMLSQVFFSKEINLQPLKSRHLLKRKAWTKQGKWTNISINQCNINIHTKFNVPRVTLISNLPEKINFCFSYIGT